VVEWPAKIKGRIIIATTFRHALFLFLFPLTCWGNTLFLDDPYPTQRAAFLEAEQALSSNDRPRFWSLLATLHNYPLYPYLRFQDISDRIDKVSEKEILTFIGAFPDSPLSSRLRYKWLHQLAKKSDWEKFVRAYKDLGSTELACYYHTARINTGKYKPEEKEIEDIWLTSNSLPDSCDPVISYWHSHHMLGMSLVWARILDAFDKNNFSLAKYLFRYLPAEEEAWLTTLHRIRKHPEDAFTLNLIKTSHPYRNRILRYAMYRMVRSNLETATTFWQSTRELKTLPPEFVVWADRMIAQHLAYGFHPDTLSWIEKIPEDALGERLKEWRIRIALHNENWRDVIAGIDKLPAREQQDNHWKYWKARALKELDFPDDANRIFTQLSGTRTYEGFLSADLISNGYQYEHKKLVYSASTRKALLDKKGIQRAIELYRLDRTNDARREWYRATTHLNDEQLVAAADIAYSLSWYDRAIFMAAKSTQRNDLEVRFPLAYLDDIKANTRGKDIDPAWALALIRQESAFVPDARSRANARGLMQLMPKTARYVAKRFNIRYGSTSDLHDTDLNIKLGINYLQDVYERFHNHPVLTIAAYNAGPNRVAQWLPKDRTLPADIWIETIPYKETRNYLRNILAYIAVYEKRLGQTHRPLHTRMPPIQPYIQDSVS